MPLLEDILPDPVFVINEELAPDINSFREGQTIRAIVNYKVIEKTKSFAGLKIGSISIKPTARMLT